MTTESELAAPGAVLRTLLISDLVSSTKLVEQIGDRRTADLFARHDRVARDLLAEHKGKEIDKTDGFLMLFERPFEAVAYALEYHQRLDRLSQEVGLDISSRVGIHLGEVFLRENTPEDVARGAKPLEVEGFLSLPYVPAHCQGNFHLFYLVLPTRCERDALIDHLHMNGVNAVFHYVPLHTSPMGRSLGSATKRLPVTESISERLVRLPMFHELTEEQLLLVVELTSRFLRTQHRPVYVANQRATHVSTLPAA